MQNYYKTLMKWTKSEILNKQKKKKKEKKEEKLTAKPWGRGDRLWHDIFFTVLPIIYNVMFV